MDLLEKKLLEQLVEDIRLPKVTGVTWVDGVRVELCEQAQVDRLLASDDYKAGWNACAEMVREYVSEFQRKADRRSRAGRR